MGESRTTSRPDFDEAFAAIAAEEQELEQEVSRLLHPSQQTRLSELLSNLASVTSTRSSAKSNEACEQVRQRLAQTSILADNVARKVKRLDLVKSRVSECQQRACELLALRECSEGAAASLEEEDFERAAAHIHTYINMENKKLPRELEQELQSSVDSLKLSESCIKSSVKKRFEEAFVNEDLASMQRFFKLFPMLDMHQEGLDNFAGYLCSKLKNVARNCLDEKTAKNDNRAHVRFADAVTILFEEVARTIEINQPLIETYYGPGYLLAVVKRLQEECNAQCELIISSFRDDRRLNSRLTKIKNVENDLYARGGNVDNHDPTLAQMAKELDLMLSEMTLMQNRTEMFHRFLRKKIAADMEASATTSSTWQSELESFIRGSSVSLTMQTLMSDYIALENFFLAQTLNSAILTSSQQSTLVLDDAFFLLKKCLSRALTSDSVDCVCAVVNNAHGVVEAQLINKYLEKSIRAGMPATGGNVLDITYHVLGEKSRIAADQQRRTFLNALNEADEAAVYVDRLVESLQPEVSRLLAHQDEHEKHKLNNCLSQLLDLKTRFAAIIKQGHQELRESVIKPRLKPLMETFVSHDVDEVSFGEFEANDPFAQNLIHHLDEMLNELSELLSANNLEAFVVSLSSELSLQLEKAVMKSKFSRLGGLLLDKEIRCIISWLGRRTDWSVRKHFETLAFMAALLNVESVDEVLDVVSEHRTTEPDVKKIRNVVALRKDLRAEEVRGLVSALRDFKLQN